MKRNFNRVMQLIAFHCLVMIRGFVKVLYGAAVSGLIGLAVYGFAMIPSEGGYTAVLDFVGAVATLCVAFGGMYAIGSKKKKGGYER